MEIFFDTEFTGLHAKTTLISIGIVADNGATFYAELNDYDESQVDEWIKENVLTHLEFEEPKLLPEGRPGVEGPAYEDEHGASTRRPSNPVGNSLYDDYNHEMRGDTEMVREELTKWLKQFGDEKIIVWSDCLSFDWVLFCNIWGHAFKVPSNIYYIPLDICTLFRDKGIDPDTNREEFAEATGARKHHAMWDALMIKDCKTKLDTLPYTKPFEIK